MRGFVASQRRGCERGRKRTAKAHPVTSQGWGFRDQGPGIMAHDLGSRFRVYRTEGARRTRCHYRDL